VWPFSPDQFVRGDAAPDALFYQQPRLLHHLDSWARDALTDHYEQIIPESAHICDLCSSWVSHLPAKPFPKVIGLGLNQTELQSNPALTGFVQHDLNLEPVLPFADASFDVIINNLSVDYLIHPQQIFTEMYRVLRPDGRAIIAFSNRCFPSKAIRLWLSTSDLDHCLIVGAYLSTTNFTKIEAFDLSPNPKQTDPLFIVQGQKTARDNI